MNVGRESYIPPELGVKGPSESLNASLRTVNSSGSPITPGAISFIKGQLNKTSVVLSFLAPLKSFSQLINSDKKNNQKVMSQKGLIDKFEDVLNKSISKSGDLVDIIKTTIGNSLSVDGKTLSPFEKNRLELVAKDLPAVKKELVDCIDNPKKSDMLKEIEEVESQLKNYGIEF